MNNTYKIASIVLILILTFFAVQASLQEVDTSGDTGTTMEIVEPQDGVSLDPGNAALSDGQSSPEGTGNSGLSVGEAGQGVDLTLGEPETPTLLETSPVILSEAKNPDGGETDTESLSLTLLRMTGEKTVKIIKIMRIMRIMKM